MDAIIRPAELDDLPFIIDSWVASREITPWALHVDKSTFRREEKLRIKYQFGKSTFVAKVACLEDDPNAILGWCALETQPVVIHYCYVKRDFRRFGVARQLLQGIGQAEYASLPQITMPHAIQSNWIYNPYRAFR